jgi:hypothetical protein
LKRERKQRKGSELLCLSRSRSKVEKKKLQKKTGHSRLDDKAHCDREQRRHPEDADHHAAGDQGLDDSREEQQAHRDGAYFSVFFWKVFFAFFCQSSSLSLSLSLFRSFPLFLSPLKTKSSSSKKRETEKTHRESRLKRRKKQRLKKKRKKSSLSFSLENARVLLQARR